MLVKSVPGETGFLAKDAPLHGVPMWQRERERESALVVSSFNKDANPILWPLLNDLI